MLQIACTMEGSSSQMLQIAWKMGTARIKNKEQKSRKQFPTHLQLLGSISVWNFDVPTFSEILQHTHNWKATLIFTIARK